MKVKKTNNNSVATKEVSKFEQASKIHQNKCKCGKTAVVEMYGIKMCHQHWTNASRLGSREDLITNRMAEIV